MSTTKKAYPRDDLDSPGKLLDLLGSHWSDTYAGSSSVLALLQAQAIAHRQRVSDAQEAFDCVSRHTIPTLRVERLWPITFRKSEVNGDDVASITYGSGKTYGPNNGLTYQYGRAVDRSVFTVPLKDRTIKDIPVIVDNAVGSKVVLSRGIQFQLSEDSQSLTLTDDPFENPAFPVDEVYEQGVVVDQEMTIWGLNVSRDTSLIYNHFGFIVDLKEESTLEYREFVNGYLDCLVRGASAESTLRMISSATGIAMAKTTGEKVQQIHQDQYRTLVITDLNVYHYHANSNPVVAVGDSLKFGDPLVDSLTIHHLGSRVVPSELPGISVERGTLTGLTSDGSLFFENKRLPTSISSRDEITEITFPVGGSDEDVKEFWDYVHAKGVSSGTTFANHLTPNSDPSEEPTASALPSHINPCQFLIENFLHANYFAAEIKLSDIRKGKDNLGWLSLVGEVLPPWKGTLLLQKVVSNTLIGDLEELGTDLEFGYALGTPAAVDFVAVDAASYDTTSITLGINIGSDLTC